MRILYLSVHAILEFDEVSLLKSLGHSVFPIGAYFRYDNPQSFRPKIVPNEDELTLLRLFDETGCRVDLTKGLHELDLSDKFIDLFDIIIVMDSVHVAAHHWNKLSRRPVYLRTIGQAILESEDGIREYRKQGLRVIRYSPTERRAHNYGGEDALIRFYKPTSSIPAWTGDSLNSLTFANNFSARYPSERNMYGEVMADHRVNGILAGHGNDDIPGSIGMVSYEEQVELLASARAYFYCTGSHIPYTLNFMEAWIAGTPIVVLASNPGMFYEIPNLIKHDVDGYVAHSVTQATMYIAYLMADRRKAEQMSRAGKARAGSIFSESVIKPQWDALLASI